MENKGGGGLTLEPKPFRAIKRRQSMDSAAGFEFPISLACREAAPSSRDDQKSAAVIGERDFFSSEKKARVVATPVAIPLDLMIKKEDLTINTGLHLANTGSDQSTLDEGMSLNEEEKEGKTELVAMQTELGRMTEENQRLRGMLSQVTNNYNALQMHFMALMQQRNENNKSSIPQGQEAVSDDQMKKQESGVAAIVPRQFMDLGLASGDADEPSTHSSTDGGSQDPSSQSQANKERSTNSKEMIVFEGEGSGFVREESPENSSHVWAPNNQPKVGGVGLKPAEQAQEATMRKARVSVRARSEAPMIADGCQWRKYGQKMAKGNPCPRAYYRCTMATGCPVRKQVQRCAEDRSILITTYEGNHNHPLPPPAMAMASTTSAAASMLLSGSMPSNDGLMNSNVLARTILPCSSSMATISASAPFPTVTLDLTQSPNPLHYQQRPPPPPFHLPPPPPPQPSSLPHIFGQAIFNQSKFSGLQMSSSSAAAAETARPSPHSPHSPQHNLADTVSAATAAITADPNFTAALAAAITSIIGGTHQAGSSSNSGTVNNIVKVNNGGGVKPASWSFPTS